MLSMKLSRKFGIKFMGVMLGMMLAVPAFASIAVSPTRIEVDANKIRGNYFTTAIEIKGDSQVPVRFKAYPGYFTINSNNEAVMVEDSKDVHDISKKIRFVPSEFTVSAGRSQMLRVNVSNVHALPAGENRAMLFIEDVNPKELTVPTARSGIGAQLIVKTRVGVPIYIDNGEFTKKADIETFDLKKANNDMYVSMKIISTGNSKVRYTTTGQIIKGKKLIDEFDMGGGVVGSDNFYVDTRKINTKDVTESGEYTLRVIVSYLDEKGKRQRIKKETNINIVGKM